MPLSEKVQDKPVTKEEKVVKKDYYRGRVECYYLPLLWWGK